jgi:hypothetical protein
VTPSAHQSARPAPAPPKVVIKTLLEPLPATAFLAALVQGGWLRDMVTQAELHRIQMARPAVQPSQLLRFTAISIVSIEVEDTLLFDINVHMPRLETS